MNIQIIQSYVDIYKNNFDCINEKKNEIYKWKAVKYFRDNWNLDAEDLHAMLADALDPKNDEESA